MNLLQGMPGGAGPHSGLGQECGACLVRAAIDEPSGVWLGVNAPFGLSQMWRNFPNQMTEQLGRRIFLNQVSGLFDPSELRIGEP